MIPKIIHLVALPPMNMSAADETISRISISNPDQWFMHGYDDNIYILKSRQHKLLIDIKKRLSL